MSPPDDASSLPGSSNSSSPEVLRPKNKSLDLEKGRFRFFQVFSRWWWLLVLLLIVVATIASMVPVWLGAGKEPLYESSALIEVKLMVDVAGISSSSITRRFMNKNFEPENGIMNSDTIALALKKNAHLRRLGSDEGEAIARMEKSIRVNRQRDTGFIEIFYRDEDPEIAYGACKTLLEAYQDRCYDLETRMRKEQLRALKTELQNKSDRVRELRKRLMDIAEKFGVVWGENEKSKVPLDGKFTLRQLAEKQLDEAEREKDQLVLKINQLLAVKDNNLAELAIYLPDAGFKEAYQKYREAEDELQKSQAAGLSVRHPDILRCKAYIEKLRKGLEKRITSARESLKHRLAMLQERIKRMRDFCGERTNWGSRGWDIVEGFDIARKDYETARAIADQMELKYHMESMRHFPIASVIIHKAPKKSAHPVLRGRMTMAIIYVSALLPLSWIGGAILMYIAEVIFPRKLPS